MSKKWWSIFVGGGDEVAFFHVGTRLYRKMNNKGLSMPTFLWMKNDLQ